METSKIKPCCPTCRATDFQLIATVIQAPTGVPYQEGMKITEIGPSDFASTREVLRCNVCETHTSLDSAKKAAGAQLNAVRWEMTDKGIKVPLVCPECGNKKQFIAEVLNLTREKQEVEVDDLAAQLVIKSTGADWTTDRRMTLKYSCAMDECTGEILICFSDYDLVKISG